VGKIVDELLEQGVLEPVENKREAMRPGRPGQGLRLNTQQPRFVLVQMGVAHTRIAYTPLGISEDTPWSAEIETPVTAKEWEVAVRAAIEALKPADAWGTLMSIPGILDEDAAKVLYSPNLHWTEGVDFRSMLHGIVNAPVQMVHEIRSLALGHLSTSPGETDFLLVDFGHGVGGAAVVHGNLYQSTLPMAGELGHAPVLGNERQCGCGAKGCLETLMSRRGLFLSVHEHLGKKVQLGRYAWTAVQKHIGQFGLEAWLKRSLQAAGANIAGAMNVLGLGRVVITGTMSDLPEEACDFLAGEIRRAALWGKFGEVAIVFAPRRRMRGLISLGIERMLVDTPAGD
jgi:predicted NBD/HSP70 family sugar kinase